MKSGKLTYEKLCRYLCPVMKDLSKIHEKGIIHGAICPDNIMVNADGEVHLLDLGVAKDLYETKETQKEDSGKIRRYLTPLKETQKEDLGKAQAKNAPQSTMVLRNGFRALEQYQTNGEIGPWTDVYAMLSLIHIFRKNPHCRCRPSCYHPSVSEINQTIENGCTRITFRIQ